eukprot:s1685_g11.t1
MPARGSHSEVRNCKFRFSKGSQRDANLHKMFADVFMDRIMNSQPSASSMPAITMLQGNGKRKRQPLALEDGDPSGHAESKAGPTDNAEPTADKPTEVEPGKSDTVSVDDMALQIQNQLQANKAEKKTCAKNPQEKNNSKAAPKSSSAKSVKPKVTKKTKWTYPGTKEQEAMHLDFCTAYTCPKSFNWRVKNQGEKKDKAFSWRKEGPLKVWERVEKYLETLLARKNKEIRYSRSWRPCQYRARVPIMGNFDGCKECDRMDPSVQRWMFEKVSWRYWYLSRPDIQAEMHQMAMEAHQLDPLTKDRLHEEFHKNCNQIATGEKITAMVEQEGIRNPSTAATLFEVMMQRMWSSRHGLWRDLRNFADLVHYIEIYKTEDPPRTMSSTRNFGHEKTCLRSERLVMREKEKDCLSTCFARS